MPHGETGRSRRRRPWSRTSLQPAITLALLSAALSAVLFLLVLLLVAGWAIDPIKAAAAVTVLPLAAIAGAASRHGQDPRGHRLPARRRRHRRAGLAARRLGPRHVRPQLLAGLGMGMALPALGGELLPERTAADAARLLTLRHAGIALALAVLSPVLTTAYDDATIDGRLRGIALVLDAKLDPGYKLQLAPDLIGAVDTENPRRALREAIAANGTEVADDEQAEYRRLGDRADEMLVAAVGDSFYAAFALTGLMAILGGALLVRAHPRAPAWVVGGALACCAVLTAQVVAYDRLRADPVVIADPCAPRALPSTGGSITGALQDRALQSLDRNACRLGATREELVLALADRGTPAVRAGARHGPAFGDRPAGPARRPDRMSCAGRGVSAPRGFGKHHR